MDLKLDISIEKIKVFSTDYFQLHFIWSPGNPEFLAQESFRKSPRLLDLKMCKWLFKKKVFT